MVSNGYGVSNANTVYLKMVDFSNALNATNLTWSSGGDQPWFPETTTTHDGVAALQSGPIAGNQQSTVQTTVDGPGTLSFWWKVSSETNNDYADFAIDGVEQSMILGAVNWRQWVSYIASGSHVLTWSYSKNASINGGSDAAWLGDVLYTAGPTAPLLSVSPQNLLALPLSSATFNVIAQGTPPLSYQWYFNGNGIPDATNSLFLLPSVVASNAGNYAVTVTNIYGTAASQAATLTVAIPPSVTTQPSSQTNQAGAGVNFSVVVNGTGPFIYQWQFNGTNFPNIITTVAGDGVPTYSGDGGLATNASLYYPQGVAFDSAGNLYIADNNNNRVRKVSPGGIITSVAGTGSGTYAGDGGAATNASLYRPNNLAFDRFGNLYVADIFNNRIRKIDMNGIITTFAGTGGSSYGGDGGAATNAGLFYPADMAFDSTDNMYIADLINNRIRKVDTNGIISTVVGRGSSGYFGDGGAAANAILDRPQGVALDGAGNLYIADTGNNRIRKVDAKGIITTVVGRGNPGVSGDGGAATNAYLNQPWFVAFDAIGELYIADAGNNRVRKVDIRGIITTVAGNGTATFGGDGGAATNASLNTPACVALDSAGNLYIADWYNGRIRKVQLSSYSSLATSNTLSFANAGITNAGNYSVIVSSAYGSVTSAVVSLTITVPRTPPLIIAGDSSFGFLNNQFGFNITGDFGQTIVVEGSSNLLDWIPVSTNTMGDVPIYFVDPTSGGLPMRFYRATLP